MSLDNLSDVAAERAVLAGDAHATDVRADEEEAAALGIHGVPFFVIAGRHGVSGAQSAADLREIIERAWSEAPDDAAASVGMTCGPEGCG